MKLLTETPNHIAHQGFGIGNVNWDDCDHLAISQLSMKDLFRTISIEKGAVTSALPVASEILDVQGLDFCDPLHSNRVISGDQFLNRRLFNDALLVMHKGHVVHESYRNGMTDKDRHVIHSCTKSLCSMLISMAVEDGLLVKSQMVDTYIPEFKGRAEWADVTLQNILDMQAGIKYSEDYTDPNAEYWQYARAVGYYPPLAGEDVVGVRKWVLENLKTRNHKPGTAFVYNSCLTNVLGMVLENIYNQNLGRIFEEKLYSKIGAESDAYFNTDPQGFPIVEGQLSLTLRDFARCAFPVVNRGKTLLGEPLFSEAFIQSISQPDAMAKKAYTAAVPDLVFPNGQYRNQFWGLEPEQNRFTMLGIHGQFAWFDLKKDLMIVGMGSYPKQDGLQMMTMLRTLWHGISDAL